MTSAVSGIAGATIFRAPVKPPEKPPEITSSAMVPVAAAPPPNNEDGIMSIAMKAAVPAAVVGLIGLIFARADRQEA